MKSLVSILLRGQVRGPSPSTRARQGCVLDPEGQARIFQWVLCETHDDKGNVAVYCYKPEDGAGADRTQPFAPGDRRRWD